VPKIMKEATIAIFISVVLLGAFLLLDHGGKVQSVTPPQQGVLNLADWNQAEEPLVVLNGDWSFYWNRLLTAEQTRLINYGPDLFVPVPDVWNNYTIKGKKLPGFGYATYKLEVENIKPGTPLAFRIPTCSTAYKMFINDRLVAANGKVGPSQALHQPDYRPTVFDYTPDKKSFAIILQVSNYNYARGGMWYALYMGTPEKIQQMGRQMAYRDLFLLGGFFIVVLYCLAIYLLRREKSSLYFALLCLLLAARTSIYGEYVINYLLPESIRFAATVRIDYFILYFLPGVTLLLLKEFYPQEISKQFVKFMLVYSIVMGFLTLSVPIYQFTRFTYIIEAIILINMFYIIACLIRAMINDREDTGLLLAGLLALIAGGVHDLMYQNDILKSGLTELSPIGFYILILLWAFILAKRYALAIAAKENALLELVASHEREKQTEIKFLMAQIRPHFIHNALNAIISISRKDSERSRKLLVQFSRYLRTCFDVSDLEKLVPLERELDFIRSYVSLEEARFGDRIKVEYDLDDIDFMLPPLILQPLVENAIIHGLRTKAEGGVIRIYVKQSGNRAQLGVKDNGAGFDLERLDELLNGTGDKRGVGLYNINQRLKKIFATSLQVINLEAGGSEVRMEIPFGGGNNDESSAGG